MGPLVVGPFDLIWFVVFDLALPNYGGQGYEVNFSLQAVFFAKNRDAWGSYWLRFEIDVMGQKRMCTQYMA